MSQDWMQPGAPPPPPPSGFPPPPPGGGGYSPYGGGYGGNGGGSQAFPWEERSQRGMVDALIASVKLLITNPREAYGRLKADGDMMGPLLFGLIIGWPVAILGQLYGVALGGLMGGMAGFGADSAMSGTMQALIVCVIFPLIYVIGVFIWAGICHLMMIVLSALGNSSFGFEGTLKVVAYSYVAYLAGVVPIIGGLAAAVGMVILCVIGLQTVHRCSMGQALAAVLLPVVLCCVCMGVAFALGGAAIMSALAGAQGG